MVDDLVIDDSSRPAVNPLIVLRVESDDWALLFNPENADVIGLDPVGVSIWKLLDGHRSVDDIASQLREIYSDVPGAVTTELSEFLNDLHQRGFLAFEARGVAP